MLLTSHYTSKLTFGYIHIRCVMKNVKKLVQCEFYFVLTVHSTSIISNAKFYISRYTICTNYFTCYILENTHLSIMITMMSGFKLLHIHIIVTNNIIRIVQLNYIDIQHLDSHRKT